MKWKRVKGAKLVKDKVTGQLKPILPPNVSVKGDMFTSAVAEIKESPVSSSE